MRFAPLLAGLVALAAAAPADAIPAFARRHALTCASCHEPVPRLNAFGEEFAGRGFRLSEDDTTEVTSLGDPLLRLQQNFPLAVRMDAYIRGRQGSRVGSDFATPLGIKLLSGGSVASSVSYYFYVYLAEDGLIGPLEDAWLMFRRPLGLPADVTVGQFQIADPLWKRELRITLEDYRILSRRVGDGAANLSYDRGVTLTAAPSASTMLAVMLVNGNGIGELNEDVGTFDGDGPKTGALWLSQEVGPLRIGAMGYYGSQRLVPAGGGATLSNRTWMAGPAVGFGRGAFELNGQLIYREDSDPGFTGTAANVVTTGGFLEGQWWPQGRAGRLLLTGLYNWIDSDEDPADYETATVNVSWLFARNLRLAVEGTWDRLADDGRVAVGFVTAF